MEFSYLSTMTGAELRSGASIPQPAMIPGVATTIRRGNNAALTALAQEYHARRVQASGIPLMSKSSSHIPFAPIKARFSELLLIMLPTFDICAMRNAGRGKFTDLALRVLDGLAAQTEALGGLAPIMVRIFLHVSVNLPGFQVEISSSTGCMLYTKQVLAR